MTGPSRAVLHAVAEGRHPRPHDVLGPHAVDPGGLADPVTLIRALRPLAERVVAVLETGARVELAHRGLGIWEGETVLRGAAYEIEARYADGTRWLVDDAYRHSPTVGELDLHLIGEGRHERLWDALGAHVREHEGVTGVSFAVWAPAASAMRVVGDFNAWDGTLHAMRRLDDSGVWELFVPGLTLGSIYKFELLGGDGVWRMKADPLARAAETPPATASVVTASDYEWGDEAWLRERAARDPHEGAMSVYELHLGSWRTGLGYRAIAAPLIEYVTALGYTHVEFMPLAEHPFGGSWGYQVTGYYAPTSRWGSPDDLRHLIDLLHQAGIGVILDWVPGHFPKDEWALARFDGAPLYEHPDPRRGEQPDWGTLVFDFGRPQVRNFLVANALYWLEEFHVDGLRVDAVASMLYLDYSRPEGAWLPNAHGGRENLEAIAFLQEATATAYKRNPGVVIIAEESTSWPGVTAPTSRGGLGFGFKWNMGWMHDSLQYMHEDPLYRAHHHGEITFSFVYAFSENYVLPISHDEVVHGKGSLAAKMPGDHARKLANLRAYLGFMWSHPGKKLLFMGQEFAQLSEWSEERELDWWLLDQPSHGGVAALVAELNRLYRQCPPLWALDAEPRGQEWLDAGDSRNNVLSFLRRDDRGGVIAVFLNFAGVAHDSYRTGLPAEGEWEVVLNTDDIRFGGEGGGASGIIEASAEPWGGRTASATLALPALSAVWLRPRPR